MSGWARALAPAKVNPWLEVLGRRADGYHEIDTTMVALDLEDVLEARATATGRVELSVGGPQASPDVPAGDKNLAARAAGAVLEIARAAGRVGPETGLELVLEKRIPSRAGLGGGSSDAAAAWIAAEAALSTSLPPGEAQRRLAELGSDCPFFLAGTGHARCGGRGEIVRPLPAPPPGWQVALVVPACGVATADVYRALRPPASGERISRVPSDPFGLSEEEARRSLFNRLEAAALDLDPELAAWRGLLDGAGAAHFRLSGSGSSFFGLFREAAAAALVLAALEARAAAAGLGLRGRWVLRPSARGARLLPAGARS